LSGNGIDKDDIHLFPNVRGELNIVSELPYCPSCTGVIEQFQKMFSNMKINQVNGIDRLGKKP
jgi:hypothetical protein